MLKEEQACCTASPSLLEGWSASDRGCAAAEKCRSKEARMEESSAGGYKLWKNEVLRIQEEAPPPTKEEELKRH